MANGPEAPAEKLGRPTVWGVLRDAVMAWIDHRNIGTAAALAYYAAFSMAPVLVIAVTRLEQALDALFE